MITIPTLIELFNGIIANLEAEFDATIEPDGKAELRVQSSVQASKLKQVYLAIAQLQKNIWVDSCDEEMLLRFGFVKLKRYPFPPIAGQYEVTVTGTIGGIIPAGAVFKSDDDALNPSILYVLDNAYTLVATTDTITLRSLTGGLEGKLNVGDTLTSTAPIAQVSSDATVASEVIQPLSGESLDDYRQKVLDAFQLEPNGGSATDYRLWAADAQGVQKVYPYAKTGFPCEIILYIEAELADSIDGKGTPTQQIIDDVESVINFNPDTGLARRPLQVSIDYLPVIIREVVITITGFQALTALIQSQLLSAFTSSIALIRPFVAAADPLQNKNDIIDTNKLIGIIITAKPGAQFANNGVNFTIDGIPMSSFTCAGGNILYLNPIIIYN